MSIDKAIFNGVKWTGIEFFLNFIFGFVVKLILAKILIPEDFGLVGMATVFISIFTAISEMGISASLIQVSSDETARKYYNTAFVTAIALGAFLFICMCCISPLIAKFYNEPFLNKLIPVLSLGIILRPFTLIPTVIFTRRMEFKVITSISNTSNLIAGIISIGFAIYGAGVWSIALYSVLGSAMQIIFYFFKIKHEWLPKFYWNREYFDKIFTFGVFATGTALFGAFTYNVDNLIIGKMLGPSYLGWYTLAFTLTEIIRQRVSSVMNRVMYPVFCQKQGDKIFIKEYFLKMVKYNAIFLFPLMFFLMLCGEELVLIFWGEKWLGAIVPLKVLSLSVIIHLVINSFGSLLRATGYPKVEMYVVVCLSLFVFIPSLILCINMYGLNGAAYAVLINKIVLLFVAGYILRKRIGIEFKSLFVNLRWILFSLFLSGSISYFIKVSFKDITLVVVVLLLLVFSCLYFLLLYRFSKIEFKNTVSLIFKETK